MSRVTPSGLDKNQGTSKGGLVATLLLEFTGYICAGWSECAICVCLNPIGLRTFWPFRAQ